MFSTVTINRILPIKIVLTCMKLGEDYLIILYGGTSPHIGAITLSCAGADAAEKGKTPSYKTSTLSVDGHKEYVLFNKIAPALSYNLNHNVAITGGIHVDNASRELLIDIQNEVNSMCDELVSMLKGWSIQ